MVVFYIKPFPPPPDTVANTGLVNILYGEERAWFCVTQRQCTRHTHTQIQERTGDTHTGDIFGRPAGQSYAPGHLFYSHVIFSF